MFYSHGCALATPDGPWCITFALGWLEIMEILSWAHWISQVQSTGLLSIFLKVQPWQCFFILRVVCLESCFCVTCKNTHALGAVVQKVDNAIQWIEQSVFLILIHWIMIHPMDTAIQHLNNRGLGNKLHKKRKTEGKWSSLYYTVSKENIFGKQTPVS